MILAGLPATILPDGTSRVTTALAPITQLSPTVTPGRITAPYPIYTKFPILQVTGNIIIRQNKFPAGFGQKSREWVATQLPRALAMAEKTEKDIPAKYWMEIPANDQVGYIKLMREARIELTKEGFYNTKMMSLLKRVRCQQNPSSFECALKDE